MHLQRLAALPVALIFAGAAACIGAQQSEAPAETPADGLTAEDIHEIEELVQGYTRGVDVGPEDASWVFAPDAIFEYTAGAVQGGRGRGSGRVERVLCRSPAAQHHAARVVEPGRRAVRPTARPDRST